MKSRILRRGFVMRRNEQILHKRITHLLNQTRIAELVCGRFSDWASGPRQSVNLYRINFYLFNCSFFRCKRHRLKHFRLKVTEVILSLYQTLKKVKYFIAINIHYWSTVFGCGQNGLFTHEVKQNKTHCFCAFYLNPFTPLFKLSTGTTF